MIEYRPEDDLSPLPDGSVGEVARLALKLGFTAFGGPAAHIAMLHDEVVTRRRWLDEQRFLDLLGATNLIPGPNSTEMVIHVGHIRAGYAGLIAAGVGFIAPAFAIVLALAWLYVRYGTTPTAEWLLYGIKPVIIAIVLQALWSLGRKAVKGPFLGAVGVAVFVLYLLGLNELLLLFGAGVLVTAVQYGRRLAARGSLPMMAPMLWLGTAATVVLAQNAPVSLGRLFLVFLKVGGLLYGSGYVLLAFLRNDLVVNLGWLTDQQLLDAIAIGQFTPGPVFTTATFVGYVVAGFPGAVVATVGIFLPSFLFVALLNPLIPRMRRSDLLAALLDGVNVAALGLMAAVTWQLGRTAVVDWFTALLALLAAILLLRFKLNSVWLVLGGGLAALAYRFLLLMPHLSFCGIVLYVLYQNVPSANAS
ncbi:MAG: chromate efflux transporter [Chloroflexi bacterium]|nr:chromate efflux transporter [Chloroflexota bacterium]